MTWPRRILYSAVVLGLVVLGLGAWIAGRTVPQLSAAADGRLHGVFHVHSDASHDSRTPAAEIFEAAAGLGLDFVLFTEHNVRADYPDSPVLAAAGTEVSSNFGHLIQFGPAEVPARGFERSTIGMVDALHARGALLVAAHPESPKRPWDGRVRHLDGFEIASTSTDARILAGPRYVGILRPLFAYAFNRSLGLAQLYRRDTRVLARWDRLSDPSVHGFCGADSHGHIDVRLELRTWRIVLNPLSGEAGDAAGLTEPELLRRLDDGAFYCVAALLADRPPLFEFVAATDSGEVGPGREVDARRVTGLRIEAPTWQEEGGPAITIRLLRDGEVVAETDASALEYSDPDEGTYRVEVWTRIPGVLFGGRRQPVVYSNRIAVVAPAAASVVPPVGAPVDAAE